MKHDHISSGRREMLHNPGVQKMPLGYRVLLGLGILAILFVLFQQLFGPPCARIAFAAECPVGATAVFNSGVTINEDGNDDDTRIESDAVENAFFLDGSTGNIGVGTAAPTAEIEIEGGSPAIAFEKTGAGAEFWDIEATTQAAIVGNLAIRRGSISGTIEYVFTDDGLFMIGSNAPPSAGTDGIVLSGGTALSGLQSNTAGLYANDVAGTVEMFAIDEAGTATQLSSHPADLIAQSAATCSLPPFHTSENPYIGKRVSIDLCALAEAVEGLTGQTIIIEQDIPRRDWWADQAQQMARCVSNAAKDPGDALDASSCKEDAPPQWMVSRGVDAKKP